MKTIEIVTLRAAGVDLRTIAGEIRTEFFDRQTPETEAREQIRLFLNPALATDLSIHLHRNGDDVQSLSDTGRRLVRFLEDYGLVNRSFWTELENEQE